MPGMNHVPQGKYGMPTWVRDLLSIQPIWPTRLLIAPPRWVSVDLRDGNQALINPMDVLRKFTLWQLLLAIGFTEIEIGFPSASNPEFDFCRYLIEHNLIPIHVIPQVLTQIREPLVARTFEAMKGVPHSIIHIYNPTSPAQRRVVFRKSKEDILKLAVQGVKWVKKYASLYPSQRFTLEYSPENFSLTEPDFARDVLRAVMEEWGELSTLILNLPETVQCYDARFFANYIEWLRGELGNEVTFSLHHHNDRGHGVASTEFAMLAASPNVRVEGTLFGNGERTGNVDIITLALNMLTQGIDPGLDFSDLMKVRKIAEECTQLPIHPRHPYAGDLVFSAFSGGHQDAIRKGFRDREKLSKNARWDVPYFLIDPEDVGREYTGSSIRFNSQSGRAAAMFIIEKNTHFRLPEWLGKEMGAHFQHLSESQFKGGEIPAEVMVGSFMETFVNSKDPIRFHTYKATGNGEVSLEAEIEMNGETRVVYGIGNGPVDAFRHSLRGILPFEITEFDEHALGHGSDAVAAAYVQIKFNGDSQISGIATSTNSQKAPLNAVVVAANRALSMK